MIKPKADAIPSQHLKAFADLVNRFDKVDNKQALPGAATKNQQAITAFLQEQGLDPARFGLGSSQPSEPKATEVADLEKDPASTPGVFKP